MVLIHLILLLLSAYFARKEYVANNTPMAMFWSVLIGWDFHALLLTLYKDTI
jgi:hypothetical protein